MAKFQKIYEDGRVRSILTFKGVEFIYIDGEWKDGRRYAETKSLEYQVEQVFKDDEDIQDIIEWIEKLGYDDEIEEALDMLSGWEE